MKMFIYQIGIFIILVLLLLVCDQNMLVGQEGARLHASKNICTANVYI